MTDHPQPRATTPDPVAALRQTVRSVSTDAAELAPELPGDGRNADILARLSEELAEASHMHRVLPGRPADMTGHDHMLLAGLRTAHQDGEDLGETIARALARLAFELGGSSAVLANRPGSWEATHIRGLLAGTAGEGDDAYRTTQ